ncbi:MAG: sigma 54-dependent Fis family transcriptional regulator [Proteobacteria bacterium]|nr:sigma 54-dependent Fis family transcriptional regulator [Pseudomonadota bacterium]
MASEITSVIGGSDRPRRLHLRRIRLTISSGPDKGRSVESDHPVLRIGAQSGNHLQLTDDTVSRKHAEIVRAPEGIVLRDLGSTNGTFVGPVRVREVYLGEQRTFKVGKTDVEFTPLEEVVDIVPADDTQFEGLVGESVAMREVFSVLERVAQTDLTVLVTGETGTGKELVSRAVHGRSRRRTGPFVVFDCGAVARNLVESELFGHERGAFTGAVAPRAGVFEQAHGGTIFIDELGELPLELQPALLRVLEQREVRRVGDRKVRPVDVRVVAATNRDLRAEVEAGRFRQDLYYRLAVVEVPLPPLRDRIAEDFQLLVKHLLEVAPFPHNVRHLDPEVERAFMEWHWPGNIRELKNVLLRAIPFSEGDSIALEALPHALREGGGQEPTPAAGTRVSIPTAEVSLKVARDQLMEAFERTYLEDLLERSDHNLSKAARLAGVDRKTVARMLKRHDLKD